MQDEVNQEESELDEVNGMKHLRFASFGKYIGQPNK